MMNSMLCACKWVNSENDFNTVAVLNFAVGLIEIQFFMNFAPYSK